MKDMIIQRLQAAAAHEQLCESAWNTGVEKIRELINALRDLGYIPDDLDEHKLDSESALESRATTPNQWRHRTGAFELYYICDTARPSTRLNFTIALRQAQEHSVQFKLSARQGCGADMSTGWSSNLPTLVAQITDMLVKCGAVRQAVPPLSDKPVAAEKRTRGITLETTQPQQEPSDAA